MTEALGELRKALRQALGRLGAAGEGPRCTPGGCVEGLRGGPGLPLPPQHGGLVALTLWAPQEQHWQVPARPSWSEPRSGETEARAGARRRVGAQRRGEVCG